MSEWLDWGYALNSIVWFALGLGSGPGIKQLRRSWARKKQEEKADE